MFLAIRRRNISHRIPKEMTCWQSFSYVKPSLKFTGSLTLNKTKVVPHLKSPEQLLIEVKAASLNPIDCAQLKGYGSVAFHKIFNLSNNLYNPTGNISSELPIIPGRDFYGEIVFMGQSVNQKALKIGDHVVGSTPPFMSSLDGGSLANYMVTSECQLFKVQDNMKEKYLDLVSIPYSGLTAWASLEDSGSIKILATGMVGFIALQLAKFSNSFARIDTIIPDNPQAQEMMEKLKRTGVIDQVYTAKDISECNQKYDLIIDCVKRTSEKDEHDLINRLKGDGRIVTLNPPLLRYQDDYGIISGTINSGLELIQKNLSIKRCNPLDPGYVWGFYRPQKERLEHLIEMYSHGKLVLPQIKILKFEEADQGLDLISTPGNIGKVVIDIETGKNC